MAGKSDEALIGSALGAVSSAAGDSSSRGRLVEHGHVVPAEPQVLEAAAQQFRLDEQVRENDAKRPLANRLRQLVQYRDKLRLAFRLGLFQDVVDGRQVRRVASRRNVPHDAPGNAGKPNRVSLLKGDVGDRPGDSPG